MGGLHSRVHRHYGVGLCTGSCSAGISRKMSKTVLIFAVVLAAIVIIALAIVVVRLVTAKDRL